MLEALEPRKVPVVGAHKCAEREVVWQALVPKVALRPPPRAVAHKKALAPKPVREGAAL